MLPQSIKLFLFSQGREGLVRNSTCPSFLQRNNGTLSSIVILFVTLTTNFVPLNCRSALPVTTRASTMSGDQSGTAKTSIIENLLADKPTLRNWLQMKQSKENLENIWTSVMQN